MTLWKCRLSVLGSKGMVAMFAGNQGWIKSLGARHIEWLELAAERHVCQFETELPPVKGLRKVSCRLARLTFLLVYEDEGNRIKGLAKAKSGQVEHCELAY
jgi:hypothetical protein